MPGKNFEARAENRLPMAAAPNSELVKQNNTRHLEHILAMPHRRAVPLATCALMNTREAVFISFLKKKENTAVSLDIKDHRFSKKFYRSEGLEPLADDAAREAATKLQQVGLHAVTGRTAKLNQALSVLLPIESNEVAKPLAGMEPTVRKTQATVLRYSGKNLWYGERQEAK